MTDPKTLPVWLSRQQILDALKSNDVIIVESPTGSGKTTQLPLILKEAGYAENGIIGITQPRRIATLSVCSYIKNQIQNCNLPPDYCAYKMRFYDTTGINTRIKILTDGMLLQEIKADPLLKDYSVIMVDEAHERSLNIDFVLGLLKQIQQKRNLKVIISSATLNTKAFANFFKDKNGNPAPIISITTKLYKVSTNYYPVKKTGDIEQISFSICQIMNLILKKFKASGYKESNDTLVFLPGETDIKKVIQDIYANCDYKHLQVYPLYGKLNKEEQELVFTETEKGKIKLVIATNIAETSLTIDGIKTVIDSGLSKINFYNQFDFTSALITKPISRSSAMQRSGRAGRTSDGTCYRLYSKEDYTARKLYSQEEILRTDLSEVVLRMCDLGITDIEHFPFITRPEKEAIISGDQTLRLINAIDSERRLTPVGQLMVKYPLLPRHSRCIVQALKTDPGIVKPVCICISFLSCKTPFVLPPGEEDLARSAHRSFSSEFGDFISYQILYGKYTKLSLEKREDFCKYNYLDFQSMEEIVHVTNQLCQITEELGITVEETKVQNNEDFAKRCMVCLLKGLLQYICVKKKNSSYRTLNADEIYIHPGSAWFRNPPSFILAGEIVQTTKLYARTVSPLNKNWISETLPDFAVSIKKLSVKEERKTADIRKNKVESKKKTYSIYGQNYSIIQDSGKKNKDIVIIPYEKLSTLAYTYRHSSRHPKSVNAALLFKGYFIHYGERLYDIINLSGRLKLSENSIINNYDKTIYYPDTINNIIPNLQNILKLSPLAKYNGRLGFIELVCTSGSVFFHVNKSFTEAINNTAYSLLTIMDSEKNNAYKDAYNKVVKLLD